MRCPDCPFAGGACIREIDPSFAYVCVKAKDGSESDRAQIRAMSARRARRPAAPTTPRRVAKPRPAVVVSPSLTEDLALLKRARECRHKIPSKKCGCAYGSCSRIGKEVSPSTCLECLRNGDDQVSIVNVDRSNP